MSRDDAYNAERIQVLEGLEHVRKRPAMYIGDTGLSGLHHLVYEVVDNAVDEALAGACTEILVTLHPDGRVSVLDNGRGIPVDIHKELGISALTVVMTKLNAGGKFDRDSYKVSGGLHGVGVSCVNALSEELVVEVYKKGEIHRQAFVRGLPSSDVKVMGKTERRGTRVEFQPDGTIFADTVFHYDTLAKRIRELAFLNRGLKMTIRDERDVPKEEVFEYAGGIREFVAELTRGREHLHPAMEFEGASDEPEERLRTVVEVAMQYTTTYDERILTFCNNINTKEGGTHLSGFKTALTRTLNSYAKRENLLKKDQTPSGDDFREGITAVISVKVPEPQFEGQTKTKLGNSDVQSIVEQVVGAKMTNFLEENPKIARALVDKAVNSYAAREAARRARDLVRKKNTLGGGGLPGKLSDCMSKKRDETELYLVEGDSAGGSAKQGRDRNFQAILALRGKILNVEKARVDKMLGHEEIRAIITALGTGIGVEEFDGEKLRYGKVIIMTDADVDGSHIRTLLLTFFFRHMPKLVEEGRIYVAQPPLYLLSKGKTFREYVYDEESLARRLTALGRDGTTLVDLADERSYGEAEMENVLDAATKLDLAARALERREIDLAAYLARRDDATGALPVFRTTERGADGLAASRWWTESERPDFESYENEFAARLGRDVVVAFESDPEDLRASADLILQEFANGREASRHSQVLATLGVDSRRLLPGDHAGFRIDHRDKQVEVRGLRAALETVRKLGQEGVALQRYKGLGEMNAEQLWETTMEPGERTLLRVRLDDAVRADEMFSILMGSSVEDRRAFIEKNALEVSNLDV